jgi:hypothetical protein
VTCGSEEIQEKTKKEAARSHRNTGWMCDLCLRKLSEAILVVPGRLDESAWLRLKLLKGAEPLLSVTSAGGPCEAYIHQRGTVGMN